MAIFRGLCFFFQLYDKIVRPCKISGFLIYAYHAYLDFRRNYVLVINTVNDSKVSNL